jgi:hypothetical protein
MIIPPTWNLPDAIRTRLGQATYGRQRTLVEEGHMLVVLHKPPGPDDAAREGVLFWRNPAGDWQFSRGGPGPGGLKRHVQSYAEIEARLTQEYEGATDLGQLFNLLEALVPLTRSARNMHLALQAAREAVKGDTTLIELRDQAYEVERSFDLLIEDVRNAIQYRTAREAEEQASLARAALQASHRLNVLAALFFPLTAIASLFGMNFGQGIDERIPPMFWVVLATGVVFGLLVRGWVTASPKPKVAAPKDPPKIA